MPVELVVVVVLDVIVQGWESEVVEERVLGTVNVMFEEVLLKAVVREGRPM
tara:strand:- start:796 stop:948 length:153 start_codon:yes stop_codon:yes gene_type:complete